jgi:ABC-2 type transport system ATP-binding protein
MTASTSTQGSGPAARPAGAARRRPPATPGPAIGVAGLRKSFGHVVAVEDVSFTASYGRITGFLGPNGAGKTTTLRMLLGLIRPDAGTAVIAGKPYTRLASPAGSVGVLLDATVHPGRSGRDHLRVLATAAGLPSGTAAQLLDRVGLAAAARQRAGGYSLGMRQRLGLAAALLGDPHVLVLDEPANGLDPQGIRWLRTFLRERAAAGGTVLLSSHVLTEAAQTVDDVVVIHNGRLVFEGAIAELTRLGGSRVAVRTPTPQRLAAVARQAGGRVQIEGARVLIEGMDATQVGELAHRERVSLHELASDDASLEQVFFSLTEEAEAA